MNNQRIVFTNSGEKFNNLIYLRDLEPVIEPNGRPQRIIEMRCFCGNIFHCKIRDIRTINTKSCGCLNVRLGDRINYKVEKHGEYKTKLYKIYAHIKGRCYSNIDDSYKYYGGRGICMQKSWVNSYLKFKKYVSLLDNCLMDGYSLDRINNNGNYEEYNLRWATCSTQAANKRLKSNNKSGYIGVMINNRGKVDKWIAEIRYEKNRKFLGTFNTAKEAALFRNNYINDNNLPHTIQKFIN